eukprot:c12643_g1_i1.p1 GENE.c12643_g1_i1~~c12643_g1_i1.p1  ORF type:complete len:1374 (-),score=345.73 c12643_g1_i1:99-4220(-)
MILLSRVNDGVCDCCDGSDEANAVCENKCSSSNMLGTFAAPNAQLRQLLLQSSLLGRSHLPAPNNYQQQQPPFSSLLDSVTSYRSAQQQQIFDFWKVQQSMPQQQQQFSSFNNVNNILEPGMNVLTTATSGTFDGVVPTNILEELKQDDADLGAENVDTTNSQSDSPSSSDYLREPDIHKHVIAFVCDDEICTANDDGSNIAAITKGFGEKSRPRFSPNGKWIAFSAFDEGSLEVYVVPSNGGEVRRLTYAGYAMLSDWTPDGLYLVFASGRSTFHDGQQMQLWKVPFEGGLSTPLEVGWSEFIAYAPESYKNPSTSQQAGPSVVGRFTNDIAKWKRYRGGQKGVLFGDVAGNGEYRIMLSIDGSIGLFCWIGERLYFTTDFHCLNQTYFLDPDGRQLTCGSQIYSVPVRTPEFTGTLLEIEKQELEYRISNIRLHTKWDMFRPFQNHNYYIRTPQSDGKRIVFEKGGQIFLFDIATEEVKFVPLTLKMDKPQLQPYSVSEADGIQDIAVSHVGRYAVIVSRGRPMLHHITHDRATLLLGKVNGPRYRMCVVVASDHVVCVCETTHLFEDGDMLVLFLLQESQEGTIQKAVHNVIVPGHIGRVVDMKEAPTTDLIAIVNHLHQLIVVNITSRTVMVIDSAEEGISDLSWSPDNQWLAYASSNEEEVSRIKIAHVSSTRTFFATNAVLRDFAPVWDPSGKFISFLSNRDLHSHVGYDEVMRHLVYWTRYRPYMILLSLSAGVPDPFKREIQSDPNVGMNQLGHYVTTEGLGEDLADDSDFLKDGWVRIPRWTSDKVREQFESGQRLLAYPLPLRSYRTLEAMPMGIMYRIGSNDPDAPASVSTDTLAFSIAAQQEFVAARGALSAYFTPDQSMVIGRFGRRDQVVCVFNRVSFPIVAAKGICISPNADIQLNPRGEWSQIFLEAWKYQRDNFWTRTMNELNWEYHRDMYLPLIQRIGARSQLTDVVELMQGDLATSHAFYRSSKRKSPCPIVPYKLGCELAWDASAGGYLITHIVAGDTWNPEESGPLAQVGVNIEVGDVILEINGFKLVENVNPNSHLVGKPMAELTIRKFKTEYQPGKFGMMGKILSRTSTDQTFMIDIPLIRLDLDARYRDWVESNRKFVHSEMKNRVGYIHVPDMTESGWVNFHRYILSEGSRDAMILDLRYNSGGYISDGLLDVISRRTQQFDLTPHGRPVPYPRTGTIGPHVVLINEGCASDCEIFSQNVCHRLRFPSSIIKDENLDTTCVRIGTRTWGGVIGIDFKGALIDGTATSQPEYSFWFYGDFPGDRLHKHRGWGIENWGVTPDMWVYTRPSDYAQGRDPQLEAAIDFLNKYFENNDNAESSARMYLRPPHVRVCEDPLYEYSLTSNWMTSA